MVLLVRVDRLDFEERTTFGGRIVVGPLEASCSINITYKTQPSNHSTPKSVVVDFDKPEDRSFLFGFLTWLTFRQHKSGEIVIQTDDTISSLDACTKVINNTLISRNFTFKYLPSSTVSSTPRHSRNKVNKEPFSVLLDFAELVRVQGNREYDAHNWSNTLDLYLSAVLALTEWPDQVTPATQSRWMNAMLACMSNTLQTYIASDQHQQAIEAIEHARRVASTPTVLLLLDSKKRAKCLFRIALIEERLGRPQALFSAFQAYRFDRSNQDIQRVFERLVRNMRAVYDTVLEGFERKTIDESWLKENRYSVCCICLDGYASRQEVIFLSCGHLNHLDCITEWQRHSNTCPVCRRSFSVRI